MSEWLGRNGETVVSLVMIAVFLTIVCVQAWRYRGDRRTTSTSNDFLVGYGIGFALVVVIQVGRWAFVGAPQSSLGLVVANFAPMFLMIAVATGFTHRRYRRLVARNAGEVNEARDAIPPAATAYFFDGDFRSRAGFALTSSDPPAPALATDLVSYWAFAALDGGDYVDFSRTIHYTTMVRGWSLASPTLIEAVPVLVAPFVHSGNREWDPAIDRAFRRTALALLTVRFEGRVTA